MAEQRVGVGEIRDGKDVKFGSSGETIAYEEVESSDGDERSGEARENWVYFQSCDATIDGVENLEFGRDTNRQDYFRVAPFDVHRDDNLCGSGNNGGGGGGNRTRQIPVEISSSRRDLEISSSRSGEARDENVLKFRNGGETIDGDEDVQKRKSFFGVMKRRKQKKQRPTKEFQADFGSDETIDGVEYLEFGRHTNKLDYFRVAPLDVHRDDNNGGGGGNRTRQIPVEISSSKDSGNGDGGPRLDQERATVGEGADDRTGRLLFGISSKNDTDGEVVIQNFEQERDNGDDDEEGGGWWEKLWLLMALWKMV